MGMKRRGTGRRQVLNLNDKQDSPRRTWQTKYQQICAEHSSQNGDSSESGGGVHAAISSTSSSKADSNNPLSGLVGHYHSDSEAEEEGREAAGKLDAKVSDFLKEIQTIAPAKPQLEVATSQMPVATPAVQAADTGSLMQQQSSVMAWQECYDENSGYIYYWNVETNAVTWEVPPEYQAYIASTTSAHNQWMMEQQMGMVPVMSNQHMVTHAAMSMPTVATTMASQPQRTCIASKSRSDLRPPGTAVENNTVTATKSSAKKSKKNVASDSEDERIEMITSYGPASEEESEDEEVMVSTKKKKNAYNKTKTHSTSKSGYASYGNQAIGPELPTESQLLEPQLSSAECDVNSQCDDQADSEIVASSESQLLYNNGEESMLNSDSVTCGTSSLLSNNVPDMGPPGDETEVPEEEPRIQKPDSLKNDQEESGYSAPDSSEDKTTTEETEAVAQPVPETENSVAECESSVANSSANWRVHRLKMEAAESLDESGTQGSGNASPVPATTEEESDESGETDEGAILSRLRSQARVLKELGGEIPDEIRDLIDQSVSETASPAPNVVEDVIAQIERELPPDYASNESKEKEKEATSKKIEQQSSSLSREHSPKTTSFALIAGYGDGSDAEEESSNNWQAKKKKTSKIKISPEAQTSSSTTTLFPIVDYEAQAGSSKEKESKDVTSVSSAAAAPSVVVSDTEVEDSSVTGPTENIPSSSKNSECNGTLFPTVEAEVAVPAPAESTKIHSSNEYVSTVCTGGLESNLPDSTTNSKAYKRKIRLEISGVYPSTSAAKQSAPVEQSTPAVVTCSEVQSVQPTSTVTHPSTTTVTTTASSTVNYSTWTYYNSDPSSGDRRGFGFQSDVSEDPTESYLAADHSAGKLYSQQKKGIINFVKAETINLPKEEEQYSKTAHTAEEEAYYGDMKDEYEAYHQILELSEIISEKVKFLGEGKDPVSPVQVMGIQIETLVSAWHAGALSHHYLSAWLGDTGAELARLEQVAAPNGWACEWDRYGIHFNDTFLISKAVPMYLLMQISEHDYSTALAKWMTLQNLT